MKERVQKIIAARGVTSRRGAEELIAAGRVTCNASVCLIGQLADPETDVICIDGKPLPSAGEHVYLMLHKPRGYVTTMSDEKGRKNVCELVKDCGVRVYPIGRLDMDSEGLLLFTNDGDFANYLMHPSHEIDKVYRVSVTPFSRESLALLEKPITLDGYQIRTPKVSVLKQFDDASALLEITIHEGRNRQVRRMCEKANMRVSRLVRVRLGGVALGKLSCGKWRHLTSDEIDLLRK